MLNNNTTASISTIFSNLDSYWRHIFGVLFALTSILATVGNGVVLVTMCKYAVLRTSSYILLANLAMFDFLTGMVGALLTSVQLLNKNIVNNRKFEEAQVCTTILFIAGSGITISCISIDRYLQITKLNDYAMSKRSLFIAVAISWLIPTLASLLSLFSDHLIYQITVMIIFLLVLLVLIFSYISVIIALRFYTRPLNHIERGLKINIMRHIHISRDKR